jgi:hypothetical protein
VHFTLRNTSITTKQQDSGFLSSLNTNTTGPFYIQQLQRSSLQHRHKRKRTSYKLLNTLQQLIITDSASCNHSNTSQASKITPLCNKENLKPDSSPNILTAAQSHNSATIDSPSSYPDRIKTLPHTITSYNKRNLRRKSIKTLPISNKVTTHDIFIAHLITAKSLDSGTSSYSDVTTKIKSKQPSTTHQQYNQFLTTPQLISTDVKHTFYSNTTTPTARTTPTNNSRDAVLNNTKTP